MTSWNTIALRNLRLMTSWNTTALFLIDWLIQGISPPTTTWPLVDTEHEVHLVTGWPPVLPHNNRAWKMGQRMHLRRCKLDQKQRHHANGNTDSALDHSWSITLTHSLWSTLPHSSWSTYFLTAHTHTRTTYVDALNSTIFSRVVSDLSWFMVQESGHRLN